MADRAPLPPPRRCLSCGDELPATYPQTLCVQCLTRMGEGLLEAQHQRDLAEVESGG